MLNDTDYQKAAEKLANMDIENEYDIQSFASIFEENNLAEYEACMETWKTINKMQKLDQFDTNSAWNNLHQRLSNEELIDSENSSRKIIPWKALLRVAAILVILLGITSVWYWNRQSNDRVLIVNNLSEPKKVELPDGSKAFLNKDAQISYDHTYNQKQRNLKLDGEAFFEVLPDKQKPFLIECNQAMVKVLGTSFDVKSCSNKTEVIVATGKVSFYENSVAENNLILLPGEKGTFTDGVLNKVSNEDQNFRSWMDHKLVFKAMPLTNVINDINDAYHCKIEIGDPSLNTNMLTATYSDIPLNGVVESIAVALNLKVVKKSETNYLLLK